MWLLLPAGLLGQLAEVAEQDRPAVFHVPRGGRAARSTTCSALLQDAASLLFWAPGAVGDFVLQCIDGAASQTAPGLGRGIITAPWKLHTHARARHIAWSPPQLTF